MSSDKSKDKTSTHEKYEQIGEQLQQKKALFNEKIEEIKVLKAQEPQDKDAIKNLSAVVNKIKEEVNQLTKEWLRADPDKLHIDREEFNDLLTRRFFVVQSFEIYGSVAGLYDYGPPACAIKANLLNLWRQHFILNENMLELDCVSLTPEVVFEASGHVARFADFMVKDEQTGECFRADKLIAEFIEGQLEQPDLSQSKLDQYKELLKRVDGMSGEQLGETIKLLDIKSPTSGNVLSEPYAFNLMFSTQIGPTGKLTGYMRPETAQGIFVNFKRLLDYNGGKMPFAGATIGQAYRNEIAPRSGLLRVREFTLAEIEHFLNPNDKSHPKYGDVKDIECNFFSAALQNAGKTYQRMTIDQAMQKGMILNETHAYFIGRTQMFMNEVGILSNGIRFRQHLSNEMAHYASDCWDAEILTSYGWIEVVGIADRSCYDLEAHSTKSKTELVAFERFDTPRIEHVVVVQENKKTFGKTMGKKTKPVLDHLNALSDEKKMELQAQLEKEGKITITVDNEAIELGSDLIGFAKKENKIIGQNFTPGVIEPSFGIGRLIYCLLEHAYWVRKGAEEEEEKKGKKAGETSVPRAVLSLPPLIAPYKTAVLPLLSDEKLLPYVNSLSQLLAKENISFKVDTSGQTIGKRYARCDDVGVPFVITVDEQVYNDVVTLRERDSCEQIKAKTSDVVQVIRDLVNRQITWEQVVEKYPRQDQTASAKVGKQNK